MTDQTFKTFIHNGLIPVYQDYNPEYVIYGDTDSVYMDLSEIFERDEDKENVIEFSDKLGEDVNKTFPQFMSDVFNVSPERAEPIQTDREAVSDKSVFFTKKRYAMHVINNEGIDCDKSKIMGLEIKKSDTPIIVQNFLHTIVDMLMDHRTYNDIKKFISDFKEEYQKQDITSIGIPTNIKTLNKYVEKYDGSFKGFPWHVKASMIYNSLCSSSDVTIRAGDKIKIIYVIHHDIKAIAFPSDADMLPSFLDEFDIDWKRMWERIDKKLENYLKPIGYDKKSLQKTIVNQFVEF